MRSLRASTRERIDTILSRLVALFGLAFTVQSIPAMIDASHGVSPVWAVLGPAWWIVAITAAAVCSLLRRGARLSAGVVAVTFLLIIVVWPLGVPDTAAAEGVQPWIWYVFTIAIAAAAVAFPSFAAGAYAVVAAVFYVALRVSPAGGGASAMPVAIETVYSFVVGAIVVVVAGTLRAAASRVDAAQAAAIESYTVAARQHAIELERTRIDAIVHDRVLASLLAAGRARGAEQSAVAVQMASRALDELRGLGGAPGADQGAAVSGKDLVSRVRRLAEAAGGVGFQASDDLPEVPSQIADALCSAAAQAVENSVFHAEPDGAPALALPVRRDVVLERDGDGVVLVVSDTGSGFVLGDVPPDRLGLRVSVVERMRSAGGDSDIRTAPGAGTTVTLRWSPPADGTEAAP